MIQNNEKKKVFIVDDDPMYQELLKLEIEQLNEGSMEVETFTYVETFLEHLDEQPDLVFLDLYFYDNENLSRMSGLEALEVLIDLPKCPHVIFVTDKLDKELMEQYQRLCSIDFTSKMIGTHSKIGAIIRAHLST